MLCCSVVVVYFSHINLFIGGIIPIEAALGWPGCYVIGGDIKAGEPERARENILEVNKKGMYFSFPYPLDA